jgi:hypothetical protein
VDSKPSDSFHEGSSPSTRNLSCKILFLFYGNVTADIFF